MLINYSASYRNRSEDKVCFTFKITKSNDKMCEKYNLIVTAALMVSV